MSQNSILLEKPSIIFSYESGALQIEIKTNDFHIYSYRETDFENCVLLYGEKKITKYFDHGKPRSRYETEIYINQRGRFYFDEGQPYGLFSIFDKTDVKFIGQVDLIPMGEPGIVEIGCILHKEYQNQGIGTDAVKFLINDYIEFINSKGFKCNGIPITKVIGTVHPQNFLSRGLIRKLGMVFDGFQERFGNPRLWYSYIPLFLINKNMKINKENDNLSHHTCKSQDCDINPSINQNATHHVLQYIKFRGSENVLNIGCGDGKITAEVARAVPNGAVIGIDTSSEIIHFAQQQFLKEKYPNLYFVMQDDKDFVFCNKFDIVFLNFALQCVTDHNSLLKRIHQCLKISGLLVATIPLGFSNELEQSISDIISIPKWKPYFVSFIKNWHSLNKEGFVHLLKENEFIEFKVDTVMQQHIFPSRDDFEMNVFPLFAHLMPVPDSLKQEFFKQVIDRYVELNPLSHIGEVRFNFPRLDVMASKAIL